MEADLLRLAALNAAYADAIDSDRLEDWPNFFVDDCRYVITTAENHRAGLAAGVVWADSRAMLEDRVAALRRANIYERQTYRHILGLPLVRATQGKTIQAETPFVVGTHPARRQNGPVRRRKVPGPHTHRTRMAVRRTHRRLRQLPLRHPARTTVMIS